jgi:hypothetical protein
MNPKHLNEYAAMVAAMQKLYNVMDAEAHIAAAESGADRELDYNSDDTQDEVDNLFLSVVTEEAAKIVG